jgi:hypothetical protein
VQIRASRRRGALNLCEPLENRRLLSAVAPPVAVPPIAGLTLINAATDQPIGSLTDNSTIDFAESGRQLSIRVDEDPLFSGSVRFNYDGQRDYKIENLGPYAIAGDTNHGRDYLPWTPALGTHTLIVTPYSGLHGSDVRGSSTAIEFNVIDSSPVANPVFINCGGAAFTTPDARMLTADASFKGGHAGSGSFEIADTQLDPLYQTWREGKQFSYTIPLPSGVYNLALGFEEPVFLPGQRTFDVLAEGHKLLSGYDIAAHVGRHTAILKRFVVTVTDGQLNLTFRGRKNSALVCAIEITPATRAPAVPSPLLVNAGGPSIVDSAGRAFAADVGFSGGSISSATGVISNTPDGPLYNTFRTGAHFNFSQPVANGHYALFLDFIDPVSTQAGQRVFDVTADGQPVLTNFDIVKEAGADQALARESDVTISNQSLDLSFDSIVGDAIVSGIVLLPTDVPAAARPYSMQWLSEDAQRRNTETDLRLLGLDLWFYADSNRGGSYPPDLQTMDFMSDVTLETYADPRAGTLLPRGELNPLEHQAWVASHDDYIYLGAGRRFGRDSLPLAYENPAHAGGQISVVFGDLHVETLARADAAALLGFPVADPAHIPLPPSSTPDPTITGSAINLSEIERALNMYTMYFQGRYPPDFGTAAAIASLNPNDFINPRGDTPFADPSLSVDQQIAFINASTDYIYVGAGKRFTSGDTVIAYENPAEMSDGINLLFGDGHIEFREIRWALETIRRSSMG